MGLAVEYKDENSATGKWLHHLFGLTFLKPEEVGDAFAFDFAEEQPQDARIVKFVDYLVDTYIDELSSFPPTMWAASSAALYRTTNTCESFHAKFNYYCGYPHPNIHVFLEAIKNMQTDSYIKMNTAEAHQPRPIRQEVLRRQRYIQEKINQYNRSDINRLDFVKCVSYKFASIM